MSDEPQPSPASGDPEPTPPDAGGAPDGHGPPQIVPLIPPELVEMGKSFLDLQRRELELKLEEGKRQHDQHERHMKHLGVVVKAQVEDRRDERSALQEQHRRNLYFGGFCTLAISALCWLFLHYGRAELIADILKLFIGFVGGFGGGVFWARRRKDDDPAASPEPSGSGG